MHASIACLLLYEDYAVCKAKSILLGEYRGALWPGMCIIIFHFPPTHPCEDGS
jgi:hypothetical protein